MKRVFAEEKHFCKNYLSREIRSCLFPVEVDDRLMTEGVRTSAAAAGVGIDSTLWLKPDKHQQEQQSLALCTPESAH
jgi:hypothetical protein